MVDIYQRYDYAWKTPGWNVQNPTFVQPSLDGYADPGLPSDVSTVHLYGEFLDWESGRPLEGYLEIRVSDDLTYTTTNTRVMPGVKKVRFNRGGFDLFLPATNDPQLTPDYLYQARLTVAGKTMEFQFSLPLEFPEVNINDLIPNPTGSIVISSSGGEGDVVLGAVPPDLSVNLTTGADFRTTLTSDVPWAPGVVVALKVGNLTWTATIDGANANFVVDKAVADGVADGTRASLTVTDGSDDQVWAVGKVVRHGGLQ